MTIHTIKVSMLEAIQIEAAGEGVKFSAVMAGKVVGSRTVDLNVVGAVLFAVEQAAEQAAQAQMTRRAREIARQA